jgi:hypothetical protein
MPCIADKHAAQTSTEHERRAQTRRPAADDDCVEDFRVGRAGRLGCDHNGDLKSSATAQDENQDERAPTETIKEPMHPRRLEKNVNITLKSALLPQAAFRWWERSGPMAPSTARTPR